MNQVSLCKNLRSKEDSDKRGKGKLSFMDCHIKIGQLELWVIPDGLWPSSGCSQCFSYGAHLYKHTQTAGDSCFPSADNQISQFSLLQKKHRKCNLPLALPALTGERGQTLHRVPSQSELTWTLASLILEPTTTHLALPLLHQTVRDPRGSCPVFSYHSHISRFVYLGPGTVYAGSQLGGRKQNNFYF